MPIPNHPQLRNFANNTFLYGSSYYPEHWEKKIRDPDPALFASADWNVVRMGEFAWDRVEPEEGKYDFSLFDETIDAFWRHGVRTILCTPTAAPPIWLSQKHPEIMRVDADGVPLGHGSRQHASHFSPAFREHSRRITQALATRYSKHPAVIGWQTDNEFHCHFSEDHSSAAQASFAEFLKERYSNIDALNAAWGTAFWSQTYQGFDQIRTPKPNRPAASSPTHTLDYYRFLDWGATRFQAEQVEILRSSNPAWFVTHNGVFEHIDYRGKFTNDLDFLSYDLYPFFEHDPRSRAGFAAFNLDWARAYAGNFVIMEHQSGPGGQADYFHDNPEPGELREMVWASVARGAEGVLLFRERCCRFGAEEFWCGVLDHDNVPRRRFREAARIGAELRAVGSEIVGSKVRVDIGIAGADFTNDEGHLPLSLGLPKPKSVARTIHRYFYDRGYAVGVVHPEDELNGLKLFFLPQLAHFDPGWVKPLARFVEQGGWLVVGARTGTKDLNNNVVPHTFPGHLSELTGVSVEEYGRQNAPAARPLKIRVADREFDSELWYESLKLSGSAQPLANWTTRHLADQVAISVKPMGRGAVLYVGTYFTETLLEGLAPHLLNTLMPHPPKRLSTKRGLEVVERCGDDKRYRFIINHQDEPIEIAWPTDTRESLLGHKPQSGKLILKAHDAALFTARSSP